MRTSDFDYELPPELIAQVPAQKRDESRLLVVHRDSEQLEHRRFRDLAEYLHPGDVLVMNNSKVIPARLRGKNANTGGAFELLLLEENAANDWWVMLRPGKRARLGTKILLVDRSGGPTAVAATVVEINAEGHRRVRFSGTSNVLEALPHLGEVPLPPYINRPGPGAEQDSERYQTVYAETAGSVAAPTAGLHFTRELLEQIRARGVRECYVTLHVGLGTFAPVKADNLERHIMHEERYSLSEPAAAELSAARRDGGRVVAVGTTSVRVLETIAAQNGGQLKATNGKTDIFIYPPREFPAVDALLTNFHLPRSTLLMLASAFAAPGKLKGRELILRAYAEAVRQRYRFFSYGDAMLIW